MLEQVSQLFPILISVVALVLFTPKTRSLAYGVVVLCILTELLPDVNVYTLAAVTFCLIGMLLLEVLRAINVVSPFFYREASHRPSAFYSKWRRRYNHACHM